MKLVNLPWKLCDFEIKYLKNLEIYPGESKLWTLKCIKIEFLRIYQHFVIINKSCSKLLKNEAVKELKIRTPINFWIQVEQSFGVSEDLYMRRDDFYYPQLDSVPSGSNIIQWPH